MPAPGDTQERFGRSYVFINPDLTVSFLRNVSAVSNVGTVGTWRLSIDDDYESGGDDPGGGAGTVGTAVLAAGEPTTFIGSLLYLDVSGNLRHAKADDIATSRIVGAAMEVKSQGEVCKYGTNIILDIFDTASVIDNDLGGVLATGFNYYLSSSTAGNWTTSPDTTTKGNVVIQCGTASDTNQMLVEIQTHTEVQ